MITDAEILTTFAVCNGNKREAARRLRMAKSTYQERYARAVKSEPQHGFTAAPIIDSDRTVDELLAARCNEYRKHEASEESSRRIPVAVHVSGPFGILHLGDPHIDDPGTNMPLLMRHIELVNSTDALFAGSIGDYSNNWVGRLAALHANQTTTAREAKKLVEWFFRAVKWLYLVGGNHDLWNNGGDILAWLASQAGVAYRDDGFRLVLSCPNGRKLTINARHDFSGRSQWNPAHGPGKSSMLGPGDDIYIAGHTHDAAVMTHWRGGGRKAVCVRVDSYKRFDAYADHNNFPESCRCPAVLTVINPDSTTDNGLVTVFDDVEAGAKFLTYLRNGHEFAR